MIKEETSNKWGPQCKVCGECAVIYWPAYEPGRSPEPYCKVHYEEAKKDYTPQQPQFLKMTEYRQ